MVPAKANQVGLDGGSCYGLGQSFIYSAYDTKSDTFTDDCVSGNRYLYMYATLVGGGASDCGGFWLASDMRCVEDTYQVATVWASHNLCFYYCNGYEYTSD